MEKVILTRKGYEKLVKELNILKTKKRREVANQLEKARAHGDLRENAEYDAAKEAKSRLESRIHCCPPQSYHTGSQNSPRLPPHHLVTY